SLVCNRPDGESQDQVAFETLSAAAEALGITVINLPFKSGEQTDAQVQIFADLLDEAQAKGEKVHAYCRTGNRSTCLWSAAAVSRGASAQEVLATAKEVGFDVSDAVKPYATDKELTASSAPNEGAAKPSFDVVIVGAGSGGIAAAASLLKRKGDLRIALIDPAESHYYQPGWTMVGGGVFTNTQTKRNMRDLIPHNVSWIKQSVIGFTPTENTVQLDNEQSLHYQQLIVSPGLVLNWDGIKGLKESLGKNGVTSNYSYEHSAYTWELVKGLNKGRAIFTQPPMPIKCAGAPQKALYLSGDHWYRTGALKDISIDFFNAGGVLFGVAAYVPALQSYIDKYKAKAHFNHTLVEVDGANKRAYFKSSEAGKENEVICEEFDMIHVCPPQKSPEFVAKSALADAGGWLDVDQFSLQHKKFANVWGLGDVMNTPNAKTMAAVRKQVPVVAANIINTLKGQELQAGYDGYGSCPLTVERGKIVLAEFGYGGKLLPSFPSFLLNGTRPTWAAWILKKDMLPAIYWHAMLKGREWLAAPKKLKSLKG
nr:bifunctional protein tyrosine phosphatase family protein/NAD(P)/FAD-dependent oxidoreductase [Gammaproteobacteria bacterium]